MSTAIGAGTLKMGGAARAPWRPTCGALPMSAHIKPEKGREMPLTPVYDKIVGTSNMFVHRWDFDPDQGIRYERPKSQWYTFQRVTVHGRSHLQQISREEQDLAGSMLLLAQVLATEQAQPLPGPVDDS